MHHCHQSVFFRIYHTIWGLHVTYNVWKWEKLNFTSSLLHFASISNLDRQYIQIFLLRVFHLWSGTNIEYSSGVQTRSLFVSTSPCFHSSWREQQHEAENGMEKHSNITPKRTIYTYLQLGCDIYRYWYVLDWIKAKRTRQFTPMKWLPLFVKYDT